MGKGSRHKHGKQGHQGGGKRRHSGGGWAAGGRTSRQTWGQDASFEGTESEEDGLLHIGGLVIRVGPIGDSGSGGGGDGRGHARGRGAATGSGGGSASASGRQQRQRLSGGRAGEEDVADGSSGSDSDSSRTSGGGSSSGEEGGDSDQAMLDYLTNLGAVEAAETDEEEEDEDGESSDNDSGSGSDIGGSEEEGEGGAGGGGSAKKRRLGGTAGGSGRYDQLAALRRFSGLGMEDEGPVTGLGWPGMGSYTSDEEDSEEGSYGDGSSGSESDDESSSGSSSSSDGSDSEGDSEDEEGGDVWAELAARQAGELTEAHLEQMSLAQRYPVQVRPRPPPLPGQQQQAKQAGPGSSSKKGKKKHKSGVKGAKGGKLAPGEKKRLKHERMEAKRAARAASRGFDLAWVNRQLEEFVLRQGDMQAFGPFGKHEGKAVQRLAALYGCRSALQGSKSNRKVVMVSATQRTCLPQGANLLQIGHILAAQTAAERTGAALDGRLAAAVAGADLTGTLPSSLMSTAAGRGNGGGSGSGRGRWAEARRIAGSGRGQEAGAPGGSSSKKAKRGKLKPVAFVSVGAINPDDTVEVAVPAAATAAAAAAAEAAGQMEEALGTASGSSDSSSSGSDMGPAVPEQPGSDGAVDAAIPEVEGMDAQGEGAVEAGVEPGIAVEAAAGVEGGAEVQAASVQLLEVVEDLGTGSASIPGIPAGAAAGAAAGLAGTVAEGQVVEEEPRQQRQRAQNAAAVAAVGAAEQAEQQSGGSGMLYTRLTALSLGAATPASGSGSPPPSARGSDAAQGITNPGRLLGLGLALGIGPEVFGAPGPADAELQVGADLSPLSPLLSKSQLRKLQRRASSGGGSQTASGQAAAAGAAAAAAAAAAGGVAALGGSKHQQPGRKGKPGRSKQERRLRGEASAAPPVISSAGAGSDEGEPQMGGLGLGSGPSGSSAAGGQQLVSGDYGYFERHTTGIGSKLLAKWGFGGEGAGLGRQQQGRAEPLQAVRRAKKLGLGAER